MRMTAADLIARFGLEPLPHEGGYFRRTWTGPDGAGSAIVYLLTEESFSALHRLGADEVYHFYAGDAVRLTLLRAGGEGETVRLSGDLGDRAACPQVVVPTGVWQGSRLDRQRAPVHGWALLGCTMAPAFRWDSFALGTREELLAGWPEWADEVRALTRGAG